MIFNSFPCMIVSEEQENAIIIDADRAGKYIVCMDPLDGSSNIDCLVSIGTIFSIFKYNGEGPPTEADALKRGDEMVAAGYDKVSIMVYDFCTVRAVYYKTSANWFLASLRVKFLVSLIFGDEIFITGGRKYCPFPNLFFFVQPIARPRFISSRGSMYDSLNTSLSTLCS